MIVSKLGDLTSSDENKNWACHSCIIPNLIYLSKERDVGIRFILSSEMSNVFAIAYTVHELQCLILTEGVLTEDFDKLPIYTEAMVCMNPHNTTRIFPQLTKQAEQLNTSIHEIAKKVLIDRDNILTLLKEQETRYNKICASLKEYEYKIDHKSIDLFWTQTQKEATDVRVRLNSIYDRLDRRVALSNR